MGVLVRNYAQLWLTKTQNTVAKTRWRICSLSCSPKLGGRWVSLVQWLQNVPNVPGTFISAPTALLHDFYPWGCLLITKWLLQLQTLLLSSRQREEWEGQGKWAHASPVSWEPDSAMSACISLAGTWPNVYSTSICKEAWQMKIFAGYIDTPSHLSPNWGFIRKKKGENEFGVGKFVVIFSSKINACL